MSRNQREGKFLIDRHYKLGHYSRKQYKLDYPKHHNHTNCECCAHILQEESK